MLSALLSDSFTIGLCASFAGIGFAAICESGEILGWYGDLIDRLPKSLGKPLGLCSKCVSGQFGFWFGIANGVLNQYPAFIMVPLALYAAFVAVAFAHFVGRLSE